MNKRTFICIIRVLTRKINIKDVVIKCLRTVKKLSVFYDKEQADIFVPGTVEMYEKLLLSDLKDEGLYLLFHHLCQSDYLRQAIRELNKHLI